MFANAKMTYAIADGDERDHERRAAAELVGEASPERRARELRDREGRDEQRRDLADAEVVVAEEREVNPSPPSRFT